MDPAMEQRSRGNHRFRTFAAVMHATSSDRTRVILVLGMLMTISPFAIDMYLPAFGQIATELGTTPSRVSLSVASYFVGLAIGQLMYGPMLDRFGRRRPLYAGLVLFMVASLFCASAESIGALIAARFFQALGGCVAWVGAASMVRDFFPVREAPKVFSLLVLILGVSPLIAPTWGGFVAVSMGWRAIFFILMAIAAVVLSAVVFFLPTTREPDPEVDLRPLPLLRTFMSILREPQFITYSLSGSLAFAALFTYVSGSPVIFMEFYGLEPRAYGILFAAISVGFIGSSQLNIWLTRHFPPDRIFSTVLPVQVALGIGFVASAFWNPPVEVTIAFIFLTMSCIGMLNPNAAALALAPFTRNIGSASALSGFLQITLASLVSAIIGSVPDAGLLPFSVLISASSLLAIGVLLVGRRFIRRLVVDDAVGEAVAH